MRKARLKSLPTESLIRQVGALSAERRRAMSTGSIKEANRKYDALVEIRRELRERGLEAQRQLLGLIDAPDPGTRCWVASSVLAFASEEGGQVLAELADKEKNAVGVEAGWILEQWRAGTFNPP